MGAVHQGKSVFLISGPWLNGSISDVMGSNVGVMLMPPSKTGMAPIGTNSGNNSYVIASKSTHQALAAEYLNFITCSKAASDYFLANGQIPVYLPPGANIPAGTSLADWLDAWKAIEKSNGSIMFMDLSTLQGTTLIGQEVQELMGMRITPAAFIQAIESNYSQFHSSL